MAPKIGEYYYLLGTSEFGKVVGFLKTKPKKTLPENMLREYSDGKYVVLVLAEVVGKEDESENFTVLKNSEFEELVNTKKLRQLSLPDLKKIFPSADQGQPEAVRYYDQAG